MESYFKPGHLCRSGVAVIDDQTVLQPTVWLHLLSDILLSICHISVTTSQFSHGPLHFSTLQPQVYIETLPFFCSCQLGSDDKLLAVVVIYPLMRPLTQLSDISVFCQQARKLCAMKFFFFFLFFGGLRVCWIPTWNECNYDNKKHLDLGQARRARNK